ncbi:MarR family winged helix-turn-helix transcriptional regulator [Labilithrix luteola]|uniref:MarR family winged helix-turn-helix transcriptional regulator n=1 Tax=Labilithrix luteola TaxID=1391654 RepID=UPI001F0A7307|nr:MarR family transcriptional regulator [Labilithrix luteola]
MKLVKAAKKRTPTKKVDTSKAESICRMERERAVWTKMHGFVTARPEPYQRECGECVITVPQATLLRTMDPETPSPMTALATALGCHASNVTGLVDRLEEQGLVERRPSEADRRVKHVSLTPKGVEARANLYDALYMAPPELAELSEEELAVLETVMGKLQKA